MSTIGINPTRIKLSYLIRAQEAFGVKIMPLMKKIERSGVDLDVDTLELNELCTVIFLAMDMSGQPMTKEEILDMDLTEMKDLFDLSEEVQVEDPT